MSNEENKPLPNENRVNPIKQWDRLCAVSIANILAPNGYSKVSGGKYRGADKVNIPFLSRKKVTEAQAVSAQIVRNFREEMRNRITEQKIAAQTNFQKAKADWSACPWWRFKEKRKLLNRGEYFNALADGLDIMRNDLNNIEVKQ